MKMLIAEDDFTSRLRLQEMLKSYGSPHIAANGKEAVEAVRAAMKASEPYDLICLDIMMPEMDGHAALKEIRALEKMAGISGSRHGRIIMTTALADKANVIKAAKEQCDHFLVKPVQKAKLVEALQKMQLIPPPEEPSVEPPAESPEDPDAEFPEGLSGESPVEPPAEPITP